MNAQKEQRQMGEAKATRVPTIGRIVIFQNAHGDKLPAIVVKVHSPTTVNLQVFLDSSGTQYATSVQQGPTAGFWDWPVQV
jgi:hypothetical protein